MSREDILNMENYVVSTREIEEAKNVDGVKIDSVRNVDMKANEFADGSGMDYKGTREFGEYFLNVDGKIISVFTEERV